MRTLLVLCTLLVALVALPAVAQETPAAMVATYNSIADTILAHRDLEANFVKALLEGHFAHAKAAMKGGDYATAAAEMSLFANEGDNAIGGVRKRLLEGGHHHHASDEGEEGMYEPGFVIVTREAKKKALAAAAALQKATTDEARKAAWSDFAAVAKPLLGGE